MHAASLYAAINAADLKMLHVVQGGWRVRGEARDASQESIVRVSPQLLAFCIPCQMCRHANANAEVGCSVRISALALLKMAMHAKSGGNIEIMGMLQVIFTFIAF